MIKKILLASFLLFLLTVYGGKKAFEYHLQQPLSIEQAELIEIKAGMSVSHLSQVFVDNGWLPTRFWLRNYVRYNQSLTQLKAGTYQLLPNTPLMDVMQQLTDGEEHQFTLTFIEGTTIKEWLQQLSAAPNIKHLLTSADLNQVSQQLALAYDHPEGLFFPDTYAYTANTSDLELLKRANQRLEQHLQQAWEKRQTNLPYKNPYEALIMASIIEKETGVLGEQKIIASVFVNRLRKKMRLQTDPTVIYGLGERYKGDITYQHLREKTAYNTYRINGLPPTPIAMPGLKAIEAALNPAETNYFYFVSNGEGKHIFSTNLADHNKAVRLYQLNKKN